MKQIGYGVVHLVLSVFLCGLAAVGGSLFGGETWMLFWTAIVGFVGIYREGVHDFGQHLRGHGFWKRFAYSVNVRNFDFAELIEDWPQAVAWPLGAIMVIWIFSTPFAL